MPQWAAFLSRADELFYGGQAGGGKTDLLLGLSMSVHRNSLIMRREHKQMTGADGIIARSHELIGENGKYNGQDHLWRGLPGKRRIEFAGIPHVTNLRRFKGRPHDFKAFDELPEFPKQMYQFINAWNRSAIPGQRCRSVSAGNPPTSTDGAWVRDYWGPWLDPKHPHPAIPGELRWYTTIDGHDTAVESGDTMDLNGETVFPRSRTFIPATLDDNPFLGDDYRATLQSLPEPLRSQLLYGDFFAAVDDDAWQVIPTAWVQAAQERWTQNGGDALPLTAIGCDPSRGGIDEFVNATRHGAWFNVFPHAADEAVDGEKAAQLIVGDAWHKAARDMIIVNIDVIGIGSSVYDFTKRLFKSTNAINAANSSSHMDETGQLKMSNVRAAYHWQLRQALNPETGDNLALPPDPQLLGDLTAPRYSVRPSGIQIEPKDKIKARLGRSPDRGEAVMLANYSPPVVGWMAFIEDEANQNDY